MPKEKNYNPVQAQRKADKAREIKKGKAEVQARRNDRLAKRNPEGIKRQIDDLKAVAEGGGKLSSHEESVLEGWRRSSRPCSRHASCSGTRRRSLAAVGRTATVAGTTGARWARGEGAMMARYEGIATAIVTRFPRTWPGSRCRGTRRRPSRRRFWISGGQRGGRSVVAATTTMAIMRVLMPVRALEAVRMRCR
ncbi:hypothetical protein MCOR02_000684 [Pyricularia oryzae]|nr:hypothetical protein MCOR02_000684 [Pyricularia oryzae]